MREPTSRADAKNLIVAAIILNPFLNDADKLSLIATALEDEIEEIK